MAPDKPPQLGRISVALNNPWLAQLLAFPALFAAIKYSSTLGVTHNQILAIFPASGIGLWLVWRYGLAAAPAILLSNVAFGLLDLPLGFGVIFLTSLANMVGGLAAGFLLRAKLRSGSDHLAANLLWILGPASILQAALAAAIGATTISVSAGFDLQTTVTFLLRWFISDIAGATVVAPALFCYSLFGITLKAKDFLRLEILVALLGSGLILWLSNQGSLLISETAKVLMVCAPIAVWLANRKHIFATNIAIGIVGMVSLTAASQNLNMNPQALLETQLFVCTFLISACFLLSKQHHQENLNYKLAQQSSVLEKRVDERTAQLRQAMERAEAADAAKSEFLANTSHEVRTPLNAILGMAEFLAEGDLKPDQREQVDTILSAGTSLMAVLNDVIDLSKVEAGKLEITPTETMTSTLLQQLTTLWAPRAREKGLHYEVTADPRLPKVLIIDGHRFLQCASNLISNAIKFTATGSITARLHAHRVEPNRWELRLTVTDTGIGMAPDAMSRLFTPFEQLDNTISRVYGGTGLGLTISRRLAELMGGTITVESNPDRGSRFTLSCQALAAATAEPIGTTPADSRKAPTDAAAFHHHGLRVLLVEDNPVNRRVAIGHLKQLKCSFVEAQNGREALAALEDEPFDLVLLDVHMPVMDGIETIKEIRRSSAAWAAIPVIALTADAMIEDRDRMLDLGMSGYASKPIDRQKLIREIDRVLTQESA